MGKERRGRLPLARPMISAVQPSPTVVLLARFDWIARVAIGGRDIAGRALAPEAAFTVLVFSVLRVIASGTRVPIVLTVIVVAFILASAFEAASFDDLYLVVAVVAGACVARRGWGVVHTLPVLAQSLIFTRIDLFAGLAASVLAFEAEIAFTMGED